MGSFDILRFKCPGCGHTNQFQTKVGDFVLDEYTLETAPLSILADINEVAAAGFVKCKKCRKELRFPVKMIIDVKVHEEY